MVVAILVVVLLSLVGGVVAMVVVVRRNRRKKEEQNIKAAESYKMYMNLEGKASPDGTETIRTNNEDSADMCTAAHYSEVDQIPSETEKARVTQQPSSGAKWGNYENFLVGVKKGGSNECVHAKPDAPTDGKLKGSLNKPKEKVVPVNAEQFYAQPDMAKKRNKKTQQQQEQEEVSEDSRAAPPPPAPYKKSLQEAADVVP